MNVGIYDTEHFETTFTSLKLMVARGNHVTLFVTQEIMLVLRDLLGHEYKEHRWIIIDKSRISTYLLVYRFCKRHHIDLLLLNTVSQHHIFLAILCKQLKKVNTILTIHDANDFFKPKIRFTLRSVLKYAGKKLLARNVDYFATLLSTTINYIRENFHPRQSIFCLPGSFFNERNIIDSSFPAIKVVIPGSIDSQRRNYDEVLQFASKFKSSITVEIILLGGISSKSGEMIVEKLKSLTANNIKITSYKELFVQTPKFDQELGNCDFIWAPLQPYFHSDSKLPEIYGLTKSSGCFYDAIRFAKPLILNADTIAPDEIQGQCYRYHSIEQLIHFIEGLTPDVIYELKRQALRNSSNFTLENIRKRLPHFLFKENQ